MKNYPGRTIDRIVAVGAVIALLIAMWWGV